MKTIRFITLLLTTLFISSLSGAATAGDPRFAAVGQRMEEFIAKGEISGAVTIVATRDGILDFQIHGLADIAAKRPLAGDSMFAIASMTKPITATAVMMLQDEGKLSVDDPIAKYIPELASITTPEGKPANLTLRHLMTHTSGMPEAAAEQARSSKNLGELIPHYANTK